MSNLLFAPWNTEQIDALNEYQRAGAFHPFTCGNNHAGDRRLFATTGGWVCPHCDWKQLWAHPFMAEILGKLEQPVPEPNGDALHE